MLVQVMAFTHTWEVGCGQAQNWAESALLAVWMLLPGLCQIPYLFLSDCDTDVSMIYVLSKLRPLVLFLLGFFLILLVVGLIGRWRWPVIAAVEPTCIWSLGLLSQTLWRLLECHWQRTTAAEAPSAEAIV